MASEPITTPKTLWQRWLRIIERFFAIVGVLLVIYHSCFELAIMSSHSMSPTIKGDTIYDGDWVLTEKISYWLRRPQRWEVLTYFDKYGVHIMKRVVGLSGETVHLQDKWIWINGKKLKRPRRLAFLKYYNYGALKVNRKMQCGNGYCVLGDYSSDSLDSRYNGPLAPKKIVGRALLIVWPLSRFGWIE